MQGVSVPAGSGFAARAAESYSAQFGRAAAEGGSNGSGAFLGGAAAAAAGGSAASGPLGSARNPIYMMQVRHKNLGALSLEGVFGECIGKVTMSTGMKAGA